MGKHGGEGTASNTLLHLSVKSRRPGASQQGAVGGFRGESGESRNLLTPPRPFLQGILGFR